MNMKTLLAAGAAAGAAAQGQGPCDIYAAAGTPCVAAHSVTRALYGAFNGALFQVKRSTDGATAEVTPITAGGVVDASIVTKLCAGAACVIQRIYDQVRVLKLAAERERRPRDSRAQRASRPCCPA
jgi:non-reducing end alpha-L-arabinofuranosidase